MIAQVRPQHLDQWFQTEAASGRPLLLDVRESWEVQTASVVPSGDFDVIAIPMGQIPARLFEIDRTRPVACMCHHGARSQRVAMFLEQQGYEHLANIAGGIDAWAAERDPSVPRY